MLEMSALSISYDDHQVIQSSSFAAKPGITCIIGESGSGKTSILNALACQIPFQCYEYRIDQTDLHQLPREQAQAYIRQHFAYFIQGNNFISDLNCYDNIALYAKMAGIECGQKRIQQLLAMVGLSITKKTYPENLSGGEKQRLALAQALARDTDIILCDEFTASLDEDLKQDILDLLKDIAQKYQKTIILTSHDPDIYEQCETIYAVEKQKIVLKKDSQQVKDVSPEAKDKGITLLNHHFFTKYISQKMERQFFMNFLYSIVCALVVSIGMLLIHYRSNYINEQQKILNRLSQTELIVVNQTTPKAISVMTYSYMEFNQPFSDEINQKIKALDQIQSIYPYYMWFTTQSMETIEEDSYLSLVFSKENASDITRELENSYGFINIQPYYPEQNFEKKQNIINEENTSFGAYLNRNIFYTLGLSEEDLKDRTLKMTIYAPVSYKLSTGIAGDPNTGEQIPIEMYCPYGVPVEIEIPIIGIIDRYYDEITAGYNIYLPIDYMESLRQTAAKTAVIPENQIPWSCNAYALYAKDASQLESLNIAVCQIDPMVATGNKYNNNTAIYEQNSYIKNYTLIAVSVTIGAGLLLAYAYGIFYYHKNKEDIQYFKRNGLTKNEFKQLLLTDCLIQSLLVIILSALFSSALFILGKNYPVYFQNEYIFEQMPRNILCTLLLAIIQTIVSRIVYSKHMIK